MSVHKEAWENLRTLMAKEPAEEYQGIEIVGIMAKELSDARRRAKEYQKKLEKEPEEYNKVGGY